MRRDAKELSSNIQRRTGEIHHAAAVNGVDKFGIASTDRIGNIPEHDELIRQDRLAHRSHGGGDE